MSFIRRLILWMYAAALRLYPSGFRERHGEEMLSVARQQSSDTPGTARFAMALGADTLRSLLEVHMRTSVSPKPGYVVAFAVFFSAVLLFVSVFQQQVLRRGADRAPAQLAGTLSTQLTHGDNRTFELSGPAQDLGSPAWLNGNSTFAAVYDGKGNIVASNGRLNGALPQPPRGIFDVMRERGQYSVTWQPRPGVRIALTGRAIPGGGFAVAGQSLADSEAREFRFRSLVLLMWIALLAGCVAVLALSRLRRRASVP